MFQNCVSAVLRVAITVFVTRSYAQLHGENAEIREGKKYMLIIFHSLLYLYWNEKRYSLIR